MPLEHVSPILASDFCANCFSSSAHLVAALSIPDSSTSVAAAMSFLLSPTAMKGTGASKMGVPPLMARVDVVAVAVGVVIFLSPGAFLGLVVGGCGCLIGEGYAWVVDFADFGDNSGC